MINLTGLIQFFNRFKQEQFTEAEYQEFAESQGWEFFTVSSFHKNSPYPGLFVDAISWQELCEEEIFNEMLECETCEGEGKTPYYNGADEEMVTCPCCKGVGETYGNLLFEYQYGGAK